MVLVGKAVWSKKYMTCECWALDMIFLAKKVSFEYETCASVSWTSTWGRRFDIDIDNVCPEQIRLVYWGRDRFGQSMKFAYVVGLDNTPCHYGGKRWWFRCPECGRRCRVLYIPPNEGVFSCRKCHNLTYESQQEGKSRFRVLLENMMNYRKWEEQLWRTRSERKRARLIKKMGLHTIELNGAIKSLNRERRRKKK